ncbi:short chain dehydrogenase domain-containing protein [Sarocladium implicatum]|nr:short chain dehydrogenase domain-containing protein [Sarocladium implicatum]
MSIRALVIGGTSGCGFGIASRLASETTTSSVIVSGRHNPDSLPSSKMSYLALDASSMRSIKQYTDAFKASQTEKLDYLVMSQGIFTMNGRTETKEGIDLKMALHYYGKQLLVRELLPVLKDDAKVIVILDSLYGNPDKLNWNDLDLKNTYGLGTAAQHCLNMTDAMTQHWATTQSPAAKRHFIHAQPGVVATGVGNGVPAYARLPMRGLQMLLGVKPEVFADRFMTGLPPRIEEGTKEGFFAHFLNKTAQRADGKKVWSDEELGKITSHTWSIVDDALVVKQ